MEALLLQGKSGYPRLTQLVMKTAMLGMGGRIEEQEAFQRVMPAFRMAMRHEKELVGYVGYLTIEAFGQGIPALAAATKIWRRMFEDEEQLAAEGLAFMRASWDS